MNCCRCATPAPEPHNGSLRCLNCRQWYIEDVWKKDHEEKSFSQEQQSLIDRIMACGNKEEQ